jgi:ketosteroid isomerase-like protein
MSVYFRRSLLSALIVVTIFAAAQEPVKPKLTPHIITATKQVTIFTGMEQQMLQAVQRKDKAGLEAMLADDFTIEMPNADPLPGDDWLDSVMAKDYALKSFVVRQMSVADLGDAAVVKFDRIHEATSKGHADSGEFFVVDLWKKSGDSWKLANRYVAKVGSQPSILKAPIKPTGKQ